MRKQIIAGNWKMHTDLVGSYYFSGKALKTALAEGEVSREVVVCRHLPVSAR